MVRPSHRLELEVADACQGEALQPAVGTDELRDEIGRRIGQDLRRRPELREDAADLHDRDEIAHLDRLVDVVSHEDDRLGQLLLEPEQLVLQALADDGIDRAEGLVHEHQRRIDRERAGDADALALATGELRRIAIAVARRVEANQRDQLVDARADSRLVPAQQARDGGDVVGDASGAAAARPAG